MSEMLWSAAIVRREYNRRHEAMVDYGTLGDEIPAHLLECLTPGAHIIESRRAVRGAADAIGQWDYLAAMPDRIGDIIWVDAGHIATSECVRAVTLVKE